MKKLLLFTFLVIALNLFNKLYAQDQPIHIAIFPFTSATGESDMVTAVDMIQNVVASSFANKDRFYILDRGQTEKIQKELDRAKDKSAIYASVKAQQGHLAQAEFIISGVVNSYGYGTTNVLVNYKYVTEYHATLRLSLQIVKVETGRTIYSEPLVIQSSEFPTQNPSDIADNIICRFGAKMKSITRALFPPPVTIIQVAKEKKGLPQQVLINGGSELFDTGTRSNCDLDNNAYVKAFNLKKLFTKKTTLDVCTSEVLTVNGKDYQQNKVIGALKIEEIQGTDLSLCDVTDGAEAIKEAMDAKKNILVKIHTDDDNH